MQLIFIWPLKAFKIEPLEPSVRRGQVGMTSKSKSLRAEYFRPGSLAVALRSRPQAVFFFILFIGPSVARIFQRSGEG